MNFKKLKRIAAVSIVSTGLGLSGCILFDLTDPGHYNPTDNYSVVNYVSKNQMGYRGQRFKLSGEIIEVCENSQGTVCRVRLSNSNYFPITVFYPAWSQQLTRGMWWEFEAMITGEDIEMCAPLYFPDHVQMRWVPSLSRSKK